MLIDISRYSKKTGGMIRKYEKKSTSELLAELVRNHEGSLDYYHGCGEGALIQIVIFDRGASEIALIIETLSDILDNKPLEDYSTCIGCLLNLVRERFQPPFTGFYWELEKPKCDPNKLPAHLKERISIVLGRLLCCEDIAYSGDRSNKSTILEILGFCGRPSVKPYLKRFKSMVQNGGGKNVISQLTNALFSGEDVEMADEVLEKIHK